MQLYLVRHAESTGNASPADRSNDPPLTARGQKQADLLGRRLGNCRFDAVLASPMTRTLQTTAAIAKYLDNPPVFLWSALMERGTDPAYPGFSVAEAKEIYPNVFPLFDGAVSVPLGMETERQTYLRAHKILEYLEQRFADASVLVIYHGTFNRWFLNAALGFPPDVPFRFVGSNTGVSLITDQDPNGHKQLRLHYANDLSHLYGEKDITDRLL